MKKKVLVTGATGFTGSHLCEGLIERGYEVRGLTFHNKNSEYLIKQGVEIVVGDLTKKDSLIHAVEGIEIVFHIAAVFREQNVPNQYFHDVNVGGTKNLLETSQNAGVKRLVHCSTVGVQGEIKNIPADETAPYNPGDVYQKSKVEGEQLVLSFHKETNFPITIFRPVGIYGPRDTRFLKIFKHINSGKFKMIGKGEVIYHYTFIKDLVDGIILCGENPEGIGQIYTIGGEEYVTLKDYVQMLSEILGVKTSKLHIPFWPVWLVGLLLEFLCYPLRITPPIYRRRLDFFVKDRAFDISKAKKDLGYQPKVDLKTGLKITADWYKQQGWL